MSNRRIAAGASLIAAVMAGGLLVSQLPANADGAPRVDDVVGVGSDVMQSAVNFIADGSTTNPGYNSAGNRNRLFSFDASGDANGRKAGTDPALNPTSGGFGISGPLNPTFILRAGTSPVQRPNGGGAGLSALIADGSANRISFARSPNLPTAAQQSQAQLSVANGGLGTSLHSVQIATDIDYIATAATTNAPATLTADDLIKIYTCNYTTWSQVPGYSGPAPSATIRPLIPQNTAGMQKIFLNALKAANNNAVVSPGACVTQVQQNDPTSITGQSDTDKPNAIVPFPLGRFNLLDAGYFRNPDKVYSQAHPPEPLTTAGIKLQTTGSWSTQFPYFVVFRDSALSLGPWQPGGTLNWAQTLFSNAGGPTPFVNTAPGKALLSDAGVTPAYDDRGTDTSG